MALVEYRKGDIFQTEIKIIGHGCNCWGYMGSGIAGQMSKRYPTMYNSYRAKCNSEQFNPGSCWVWTNPDPKEHSIANLGTQLEPGNCATLEYVQQSLEKLLDSEPEAIALPHIGAGIGGLKWEDVKSLIEDLAVKYPKTKIVIYEL